MTAAECVAADAGPVPAVWLVLVQVSHCAAVRSTPVSGAVVPDCFVVADPVCAGSRADNCCQLIVPDFVDSALPDVVDSLTDCEAWIDESDAHPVGLTVYFLTEDDALVLEQAFEVTG